jgi:hypothetical protein
MTLTPVATTEAVLGHHLQCFGAGNLDGILSDYAPDAVMCAPNGTDTFVVRNGKSSRRPSPARSLRRPESHQLCGLR